MGCVTLGYSLVLQMGCSHSCLSVTIENQFVVAKLLPLVFWCSCVSTVRRKNTDDRVQADEDELYDSWNDADAWLVGEERIRGQKGRQNDRALQQCLMTWCTIMTET